MSVIDLPKNEEDTDGRKAQERLREVERPGRRAERGGEMAEVEAAHPRGETLPADTPSTASGDRSNLEALIDDAGVCYLEPAEIPAIAHKLGIALAKRLEYYRTECGLSQEEAFCRMRQPLEADLAEWYSQDDPRKLEWNTVARVQEADPQKALGMFARAKIEASEELKCGHTAADACEGYGGSPWDRAKFLAIRDVLMKDWQPRGGTETLLIDTLAQAHFEYQRWLGILSRRLSYDGDGMTPLQRLHEQQQPPMRLTNAEAIERAQNQIDRWNRIFLRTLRTLRDLRRYSAPIQINHPAQVNIGERQINVQSET
jgi:hypothetical protein